MRRISALLGLVLAIGCGSSTEEATPPTPAIDPDAIPEPAPPEGIGGLGALPAPSFERREALLGRALFHDPRLSGDGSVACVSCHQLDHGGAEPRRTSLGIRGQEGPINAPPVLNAALNFVQFWDGRAPDLETQCAGPITNPLEMGATWDQVIAAISADPAYVAEFTAIYGADAPIRQENVVSAISEYERMLITPGRFDRFVAGDASALTEDERRGYALFVRVGCTTCHTGPNVGGTMYMRMGLVRDYFAEVGRPLTDADMGCYNVTHDEADRHRFKVPTLRNVALTAPYLHDGSQSSLPEVVRVMGRYQLGRELGDEQVRLLVAFLGALTGELPPDARPTAATATPTAPAPPEGSGDRPTDPSTTAPGTPAPGTPAPATPAPATPAPATPAPATPAPATGGAAPSAPSIAPPG
jgi:cytochrome c peroxidase